MSRCQLKCVYPPYPDVPCDLDLEYDQVPEITAFSLRYWDRYDEGVFVGGQHSGSVLHVDQVASPRPKTDFSHANPHTNPYASLHILVIIE
jgi:hypothetical protein